MCFGSLFIGTRQNSVLGCPEVEISSGAGQEQASQAFMKRDKQTTSRMGVVGTYFIHTQHNSRSNEMRLTLDLTTMRLHLTTCDSLCYYRGGTNMVGLLRSECRGLSAPMSLPRWISLM